METVACELCGSDEACVVLRQKDLLHHATDEEFTVVRCARCSLLYLNPRPTMAEMGRYYPAQYFTPPPPKMRSALERSAKRFSRLVKQWIMEDFYGYPGGGPRRPWHVIRRLLLWPEQFRRVFRGRDLVPWVGHGRLLDVGCGPGGNLATLQDLGWDAYGIELSEAAVEQARARVGDRIHMGTLDDAPFAPESFDVVMLSHSLEHLYGPAAAIARVRHLLKPNGLLIIAVPNAASLEAKLFGQWWVPWDPPRHLYHFEPATLTRLLEQAGFRVVRSRTGVGSLYFMASLDRAWTQRFRRALPMRKAIERLIARPFCLAAGHLGYGTEMTVHAVKQG